MGIVISQSTPSMSISSRLRQGVLGSRLGDSVTSGMRGADSSSIEMGSGLIEWFSMSFSSSIIGATPIGPLSFMIKAASGELIISLSSIT